MMIIWNGLGLALIYNKYKYRSEQPNRRPGPRGPSATSPGNPNYTKPINTNRSWGLRHYQFGVYWQSCNGSFRNDLHIVMSGFCPNWTLGFSTESMWIIVWGVFTSCAGRCKNSNRDIKSVSKLNIRSVKQIHCIRGKWDRVPVLFNWPMRISETKKRRHEHSKEIFIDNRWRWRDKFHPLWLIL